MLGDALVLATLEGALLPPIKILKWEECWVKQWKMAA